MKIVVIGGAGLIGSKVVANLNRLGHEALAAAPNSRVNTITGEGLAEALDGAKVVVDVANSPSFEDAAALFFFQTAGRISSLLNRPPARVTTWRSRSSARIAYRRAATSGPSWSRRS